MSEVIIGDRSIEALRAAIADYTAENRTSLPGITVHDVAAELKLGESQARRMVQGLLASGRLERIGYNDIPTGGRLPVYRVVKPAKSGTMRK